MAIITLTTDWSSHDYYLGALKGVILSKMVNVTIVDLNHQIPPFNAALASFIVQNAYHYYPEGTVHIIDVNSEVKEGISHVAVMYNGHYFIGTDNGSFSLIFNSNPSKIISIKALTSSSYKSFSSLEVFAPAAVHICSGKPIENLGMPLKQLNTQSQLLPVIEEALITGSVLYFDSFKNAITNINRQIFDQVGKGRTFEILIQSNRYSIRKLNENYNQTEPGEILAIFNVADLLEIAIHKGNISDLLHLRINSTIRIKFYNSR